MQEKKNTKINLKEISYEIKKLEHRRDATAFLPTLDLSSMDGNAPYDNNITPRDQSAPLVLGLNLVIF